MSASVAIRLGEDGGPVGRTVSSIATRPGSDHAPACKLDAPIVRIHEPPADWEIDLFLPIARDVLIDCIDKENSS